MCPSSILDGNKGESCITNQEACMANEISRRKAGGGGGDTPEETEC